MTNNNKLFLSGIITLFAVLLAPTLSFAAPDCRIPGSNPPHYNVTCEGLNTKQWNNTFSLFENMSKNIVGNMTK